MVSSEQRDGRIHLVLRPNCSLSWRGNQYVLLCVCIWMGAFGLTFAALGAWMILPFVGLEVLALAAALYYVSWKLSHCETLSITEQEVIVTRGTYYPKSTLRLPRDEVVVHVVMPKHDWDAPRIHLVTRPRHAVRVGAFLNQSDCRGLVRELVAARLALQKSSEERIKMAF